MVLPFIVTPASGLEIPAGPAVVAVGLKREAQSRETARTRVGHPRPPAPVHALVHEPTGGRGRRIDGGIVLSEDDAEAARIYDPGDSPLAATTSQGGRHVKRRRDPRVALLCVGLGLLGACASVKPASDDATQPTVPTVAQDCASSTTDQAICMPASSLNLNALPLGNGKVSSAPEQGYIWTCQAPAGGQPVTIPPWVDSTTHTWSLTRKVAVEGDVRWHKKFKASRQGTQEVLVGNGLPARSGHFPVSPSDPVHRYNPDPTAVTAHTVKVTLPYDPTKAASPQCVSPVVGLAADGIPIDDGFDEDGNDAAAIETQDICHGHPNGPNGYHFHSLSPCLLSKKSLTHTTQVG